MRLFVAITLPEEVLDQLEALADRLSLGRIPPRENLHLTLAFLDEVADSVLPDLHTALGAIRHSPVSIVFSGLDIFGTRRPETLHATVRPDPGLVQLHDRVLQAARATGLALGRRRYRPHVTLARFNRALTGSSADRLAAFLAEYALETAPAFEARSFALFRSTLGYGPARHEELACYPLGDGVTRTSGSGSPAT